MEEDDEKISWSCWLRTVWYFLLYFHIYFISASQKKKQTEIAINTLHYINNAGFEELFAGSGAIMAFVFFGINESQSAVLLPQLKEEGSFIHVNPDEETWIASLGIFTAPISSLFIGPVIDAFGRKIGLLLFYLTMASGFGIIACATRVHHIYIGRVICAFAVGLVVVALVYLTEISTKKQRSLLLSITSAFFASGVSIAYIIGGYLPWNVASAIFSLACFTFFIIQCFAPESPAWLFKESKLEASTRSLQRLGRTQAGILQEFELLKLSSKEESEKLELKLLLAPTVWKPLLILLLYHLLQCGTGVYHEMFYMIDFIERLGTTYDPLAVSIVLSAARLISTSTAGIFFIGYVSRRFTTVFSGFWMTVTSLGLGTYEYMYRDVAPANRALQWVPVTLFITNVLTGLVGVTTLPWLMSGEVFPLRVRGAMTSSIFVAGTTFMFVFIKMYNITLEAIPFWGLLFCYAASSFFAIFLGIYLLPETQNKTLYEIEQSFLPKSKRQLGLRSLEEKQGQVYEENGEGK